MERRTLVVVLLTACTPAGPAAEPRPAPEKTTPPVPETVAPSAPAVPEASSPPDAAEEDVDEASQVRTITIEGAPPITIRQLGAALIEVSVAPSKEKWTLIELERHVVGDESAEGRQHDKLTKSQPAHLRALHTAQPSTSYSYRARTSGDWSEPVTLHIGKPNAPPPAPASPSATAETPFAVRVKWQADVRGTAGYEVQMKEGNDFVRVALVDPTVHEFVHHMREPKQTLWYRVRAFNSRGASPPSDVVSLTTPERGKAPKAPPMGPCVTPVTQAPQSTGCDPEIEEIASDTGGILYNVPGAGYGCKRHLMGDYKGCRREFGVFELQADVSAVPLVSNEGWPLLHAIAGAGEYVGAQILTLQFSRGRYAVVDTAGFCGERPADADDLTVGVAMEDLTQSFPPFDECQMH